MGEIVTIERMGFGPEAVAHLESGKAVFVEGGAPGDVLAIELTEEKHSFARARIVEVKGALRRAAWPPLGGAVLARSRPLAASRLQDPACREDRQRRCGAFAHGRLRGRARGCSRAPLSGKQAAVGISQQD